MTSPPEPGKGTVLRGGSSTLVVRILVQVIQFAIFIFAAKLMSPEEFGVFALIAACIVILNQLATAGWPEYVLQWHGDSFRLRQTLYIAGVSSVVMSVLGFSLSFIAGLFTDLPNAVLVAQVLAISVFFTATGSTYAGILNWQNKLTAAALISLLAEVVNLVVAIWALMEGLGILALAYGRLACAVVAFLASAVIAGERPSSRVSFALVKEISLFSSHFVLTRLLGNLRIYAATFIVGGALGAAAAGYYRLAQRIVAGFEEIIGEPSRVLAWSLFRKARAESGGIGGFGALSRLFFRVQLYVAVPVFVGIAILAPDLIEGLIGPDWAPAAPVMQILAIVGLIRISSHATLPILSLAEKTALLPRITLLFSIISILCIAIGASFGMIATALAELVATLVIFVINARITGRHANLDWPGILTRSWRVLPALCIALIPWVLSREFGFLDDVAPLLRFFILCVCMIAVFVPSILILDSTVRTRLITSLRKN